MRMTVIRHGSCPAPDDEGLGDFRSMAQMRADARCGSRKLRNAILRLKRPPAKPRQARQSHRYGTHLERQMAIAQVERLKRAVADYFGMSHELMTESRGAQDIAEKRQVAMYLAREVIQASYADIGRCFGGKDHTTVLHACRVIEDKLKFGDAIAHLFERLGG